jgi:presenilin 1
MADTAPSNNDGNCLPPPPPTHYRDDKNNGRYEDEGYFNAANDDTSEASFQPLAVSSASEDEMDVEGDLSLNELMYSAHSFHVISLPVTITMVLAAMAVTYINTPETIAQGEQLMSQAYHVWKVDAETDSTSKQLAVDFANSLVIVSAIGAMTFGIVLLYKYRCMKVLIGYMMFSSMTLLGVLGAELFNVAIDKYRIPIGKKVSSLLACLYFI